MGLHFPVGQLHFYVELNDDHKLTCFQFVHYDVHNNVSSIPRIIIFSMLSFI